MKTRLPTEGHRVVVGALEKNQLLLYKHHLHVSKGGDLNDENCSGEVWPYGFDNAYGKAENANILSLG